MAHDVDGIEQARDAVARESWVEAYAMLQDIEPSDLGPADLEGLADATWWLSKVDESIAARQKAYAGYAAEANDPRAGFMAGRLAVEHFDRGEPAVAAAHSVSNPARSRRTACASSSRCWIAARSAPGAVVR